MESRFFCEEHGEELEVENVTSRGGDVYIFVAPCKQCTAQPLRAPDEATGCAHRFVRPTDNDSLICDDCGKTLHR